MVGAQVVRRPALVVVAWLLLILTAAPAPAHHSYAPYEATQVRSLAGSVMSFHWNNPHVTFSLRVIPEGGGEPQEWQLITSSPNILKRFDWTRDSVKPGDRVQVMCNPRTDGSYGGRLHTLVMLKNGRVLKTKLSAPSDPTPD